MTFFVPLESPLSPPSLPTFLRVAPDPDAYLAKVVSAVLNAKRIVVVCGAGISVKAGIPDFRSSDGIFRTLKRENPREVLGSGKELFDASVFNSEQSTILFCQMIARLSELSSAAEPTAFHRLLRTLDDNGKLLRVYTQNIDSIERKCGLSFGVPEIHDKRPRSKSKTRAISHNANPPILPDTSTLGSVSSGVDIPTSTLPASSSEIPRCIPLHGTLQLLHCQVCNHSFPLEKYLASFVVGQPPLCPDCISREHARRLMGKRARTVGKLRPSVVLYNEAHRDGEGVGEVVRKDLMAVSKGKGRSGADLLLVVGTSLRIPGTKRMVREFSKAIRARGSLPYSSTTVHTLASSSPSSRPRRGNNESAISTVYLNLDFPVPTRDWDGVFDVWLQGDAQRFAEILQLEFGKCIRNTQFLPQRKQSC
ncbi:hypothetical protein AMATHDRAFT_73702 [Amanita thiersii Skay4041]|uniref:Deacetylase sirtuin-type domain-containing protein n=1 Tax=Amanita thiersii Skay4041 TaxID=703135 RepID=A0A2A9NUZ0_9AGAR|nr:hypothetical protein AMATHDRAFT_73702 [Amanita thiersii Skay4041]